MVLQALADVRAICLLCACAVEALQAAEKALMNERQEQSDDDTEYIDEVIAMIHSMASKLLATANAAVQRDEL